MYACIALFMQSEYIQLCKTLYSLLQDSPDEQELFRAMGNVANSLLGTGEENVQVEVTLPSDPAAESSSPSRSSSRDGTPPSREEDRVITTPPTTPPTLPSLGDTDSASKSSAAVSVGGNYESEREVCVEGVPSIDHSPGTTDAECSVPKELGAFTTPLSVEDSFEQAMANAGALEEKWFLTFEQFVGALQREPFLCQFFAEQNSIDLSGTSVDPVLNPYTRTILATSP